MTAKNFDTQRTTMRLPGPVLEALKDRADREFTTVTALVIRACREYLAKPPKLPAEPPKKGRKQ